MYTTVDSDYVHVAIAVEIYNIFFSEFYQEGKWVTRYTL